MAAILILFTSISNFGFQAPSTQKSGQVLQNEVTVRFKLIQVYVADKKGNPVSDMKPEDFEIRDNGMPKQVEHFERHSIDMLEEKESIPEGAKAAPQKPAEPARRKFFLFFDTAFNEPRGLKRAQEAALDFLETQASPSDEVGVVSYSSLKGLTIHEYLTGDIERVREVVKKIGIKEALGRAEELEDAFGDIMEYNIASETGFESEFRRDRYTQQVLDYLNDVRDMAKAMGRIPGCKNIILFSGGFAGFLLTGARFVNAVENPQGAEELKGYGKAADVRSGNAGVRTAYADMIRELKASNCPVYSFDVARPRFSSDSFEKMAPDLSSLSQRDLWGLESLQQLSRETGGRYFSNASNPKTGLREIQKITGTYYVLGFPVEETWDGKFHKVEVSVKRKGCSVYGESGYYNPKPYAEYTTFEKQLHLIDLALGKEPYFQEKLQIPFRALLCPGHDSTAVSLLAEISRPELEKLAGGRIEAVAILFDQSGKILSSKRDEFSLTDVTDKIFYQTFAEALPAGHYDCRFILRNLETGQGARAQAAVSIPELKKDQEIRLYPPLLLLENAGGLYLGDPRAHSGALYGNMDLTRYRPVVGSCPAGLNKLTALVQYATGEIAEPDIRLSTALIHLASGNTVPCSAKVVSHNVRGPLQAFLIEIIFGRLSSGEYSLNIFALEAGSTRQSSMAAVFRVD